MQKNNILYKYATQGRMKVGMKIQIACWTVLIFKNILNQFLDEQGLQRQQEAECIQFFYNNSRILDWNQKLGRPMKKDMTFYRPLNKCKPREGTIPFVQGVVIRIIANKKILNQQKRQSVYEHFLELLAQNNLTFFMRFQLPPEVYLYQSFRLNYLYQFTQIIYPQTEYLLFTQHKSTSVEIKKQKNLQKINQVFLSRFLKNNSQLPNLRAKNYKLTSQLDNCFDFVATDGKFQHDKEGIINVQPIKQGKLFYQHYKLTIRYNKYYLVKTKFSNIKTKIPNIYCHQFKA